MSKELDYINEKIKDLEFKIEHPREYQISPLGKVRINDGAVFKEELEILKSIKQRLEAIDNASTSEAMECLENLCDEFPILKKDYKIINRALLKAQEQEKVLKIIKKKKVNIDLLYASSIVEQYNDELVRVYGMWFVKDRQLTKDEFDALKRVL